MEAFVAFTVPFVYVLLLTFQSANVRDSSYHLVFVTSCLIGLVQVALIGTVYRGIITGDTSWFIILLFILGGAVGAITALRFADHLRIKRGK